LEVAEVVAQPHCPIWFTHFTHLYTHPPYAIVSARPKVMSGYRSESLTYSGKNYRCIGVCWWNGPPGGIEGSAPDSRQTSSRPQPSSYGTTQFTLQAPPRRADPFSLLCGRSAAVRPPPLRCRRWKIVPLSPHCRSSRSFSSSSSLLLLLFSLHPSWSLSTSSL